MIFIIACGRGGKSTETAYITVEAEAFAKPRLVHQVAADGFRKQFNLASNIEVQTATLVIVENEEEAKEWTERLEEIMAEKGANNESPNRS